MTASGPALNGDQAANNDAGSPSDSGSDNALVRYLARFDDGEVIRWAFRGLLIGTCAVLGMDLYDLYGASPKPARAAPEVQTVSPILPPNFKTDEPLPADPRRFVTGDPESLRSPMRFTLGSGGILSAEGAIDGGSADRLKEELNLRGEYVKIVSLNSPGGALEEAIAMAQEIRERKLVTEVVDGALCASSCPLVFAGGEQRLAGSQSAIGVHQFFAAGSPSAPGPADPARALSDAQITTARISRHLTEMGVDPAIWLHAMDTPPQSLYYLSQKELSEYRLSTGAAKTRDQALGPQQKARSPG